MGIEFALWHCPVCALGGQVDSGCPHCHGYGLTNDIAGWEQEARPVPRPPAVMKSPCVDCATRPGSPERDDPQQWEQICRRDAAFHCHWGMPVINGGYRPAAMRGPEAVGYLVCGGWWDWATTGELPTEPYRQVDHRRTPEK